MGVFTFGATQHLSEAIREHDMNSAKEFHEEYELEQAYDDVIGALLQFEPVTSARREETAYSHKIDIYTKVPTQDCTNSVRWIDVNKQDEDNPK